MELERRFATDEACGEYLAQLRWPRDFSCPACGTTKAWATRRGLRMCATCGHQVSVTAGTIFQDTRTPLTLWFRAIWWMVSQKPGASARPRRVRRRRAPACPPGRLAPQALAAGHAPGRRQPGASRLLPRRVHIPVQPPDLTPPRQAVLPPLGASRGRGPRALRRDGQGRTGPAQATASQPVVGTGVKGIPPYAD